MLASARITLLFAAFVAIALMIRATPLPQCVNGKSEI